MSQEPFGSTQCGQDVFKFQLTNREGARVELINYGAAIVGLHVPDKNGTLEDVVLGFDDIDGNLSYHYHLTRRQVPRRIFAMMNS